MKRQEEDVKNNEAWNHNLAVIGWGALLIWWGIVMVVDPLTISIGAIGTGLILLAVNGARRLRGIPTLGSTTTLGVIALGWGVLTRALALRDERAFAALLIVIGAVMIGALLLRSIHRQQDEGLV
jgi:hypothetical protein